MWFRFPNEISRSFRISVLIRQYVICRTDDTEEFSFIYSFIEQLELELELELLVCWSWNMISKLHQSIPLVYSKYSKKPTSNWIHFYRVNELTSFCLVHTKLMCQTTLVSSTFECIVQWTNLPSRSSINTAFLHSRDVMRQFYKWMFNISTRFLREKTHFCLIFVT